MTDVSEESWDFFISFATPDKARAEELADLLQEQGWQVFLAEREIAPGEKWRQRLTAALRGSRVVVALLSDHSSNARFQDSEIAGALRLELRIVPVYLQGVPRKPADWELGLHAFQRIDLRQTTLAQAAEKLGGLLDSPQPEPATPPRHEQQQQGRTVGEVLHGAALRIDREKQWLPIVDVCRSSDSGFFLVHGPRQQNLDLFLSRLWCYLAPESGRYQQVCVVPRRVEFATPRSAAAWENNLRAGLDTSTGGGTAEDLLREATRKHPVFLVLNRWPIGRDDWDEAGVELEAFEDFLGSRLPGLIARAATGGHPIRALLAVHHDNGERSLVDRLDEVIHRGCLAHGIRRHKLPPLRPLEWDDLEAFLDKLTPQPPRHVYGTLQEAFAEIDLSTMPFREVVELLGRKLF